ncbi:MAG: glycosyltransferase family 2 protein [Chloroflexota bacterium]|nr:glycosyltransferase family 2 protein [Chloroflexota bacterium]
MVGWILFLLYLFAAAVLAMYGFNTCLIAFLYWRRHSDSILQPPLTATPRVTVQLPIYDELYVVERLIDAAAALDWQRDRLQIQVLDDSDDETTAIAQARVDYFRRRGIDIALIRRTDRSGFKAGALAAGLPRASGEFIAIFDADFVPPADFLKRTIPHFARADVGLVQTRWGHLNATYSALTRAQSIALDGHFVVEQTARSRAGLFFNFNGTAGVWRRECIDRSGGWQGDTLSEDLDLSYRAQMDGWQLLFLPEVVAPAEIPPQIHAFKRQQFRWAKGSTQCLIKLAPRILTAPNASRFKRAQGLLHLSGYVMNPLILLLVLTLVPLIALKVEFPGIVTYLGLAMLGPIIVYALAQRALYPDWLARYRYFAVLLLLGTGIALNNSIAVFEAITRRGNKFRRTPKFSVEENGDAWNTKRYTLPFSWESIGELALSAYAFAGVAIAWQQHLWWSMPFLILYAAGFGFTGGLSLWHSLPARRRAVELVAANS